MNWIITPEKYLKEDELLKLKKVCSDAAILAKAKNNWIGQRDWLIIDVAINTGLRVQELCNLKKTDIFHHIICNSNITKN